ncbi:MULTISPECIES: DUF2905 domain-containing protein [Thermoactinomyces]|jgi:hypothetical protein|uniref:DUF2905 domain-containing protein n=1 Tax=Thermoactinomyces daqus TaxID=1329516 RepID=A0A7W1X797_9BACL|nr:MULTISPECIES: DUF2905 domain-containing protein [Thermoactinomyces]MBA4541355.1 DUF2905 domain-containing protein [Thermoactinomyces daqus]MBH8596828.1 DUF2905 domain-containing protein [Thermoactinomyces sp. CICC 10523]MBH8603588.1 DUF2905 domain-containing protein [Thermoactinomyces sp. CICC 10522]
MNSVAKMLMLAGVILFLLGLLWQTGGKFFPLGRLPGDIVIEKENVKFYFPIVTCIVISVILTLISYFFRLFR